MPKPRPGLAVDPLDVPPPAPRIPSVVPTRADTPAPEPTAPPAAAQAAAAEPADPDEAPPGPRTRPIRRDTRPSVPTERRPDSIARLGPIGYEAGAIKQAWTGRIDPDLLEEARDAYSVLQTHPEGPLNLSALVEEALRREVVRLQDTYNEGQPFPHRRVPLRSGGNNRSR